MQAVAKGGYGSTKVLLLCGILTGPLFLVVAIIQAITRSGYNVRLNAVSQLSLGDRGWIQITSFLLAGLLGVRCATGVRRLLKGQKGEGWAAFLDGTFGLGLIVGAVFSPDPGFGLLPRPGRSRPHSHERPHATQHAAGFFLSMFPSSLTASFFCAVSTRLEKGWAVSP
jgi:hypothetical membrane protein